MFGGTLFMPDVEFGSNSFDNAGAAAQGASGVVAPIHKESSAADVSVIPEVALAKRLSENLVIGIGMYGVAGMGTDYRDTVFSSTDMGMGGLSKNGSFGMRTNLQLMRFALPIAYETSGFSIGIAPMIQYGSLNIATVQPTQQKDMMGNLLSNPQGTGVSDDLGFGYEIGVAYTISGLTLGAKYQSAIDMEYTHTIADATKQFGLSGFSDNLEQPAEIGIGASYELSGNTIALDYKMVNWASASGYKDFGWEDQNVIALGYQYEQKGDWAVRLGYNYASNPIKELDGSGATSPDGFNPNGMPKNYENAAINFFNMAGFPAVVEQHFTLGGTYFVSEKVSFDLAYTYAPKVDFSYDTTAMAQGLAGQMVMQGGGDQAAAGAAMMSTGPSSADVGHSQTALTFAMNCEF